MSEQTQTSGAYPFGVLRVLATSARVTKRNLVPFFVLACVLEIPSLLLELSGTVEDAALAAVMSFVTHALTSAVVAYGVIMELLGTRPSTRACIATGLSQVGPVLGVTIVTTFAMLGAMLLLFVPGVIVALMFYVVVPVTVFEGLGIRAAMRRSRELTDGRKGDLFLLMVLGTAVNIAIYQFGKHQFTASAAIVCQSLGSAVSSMFFAVTAAVAYVELRKLRDGVRIPEIATAFARIRK